MLLQTKHNVCNFNHHIYIKNSSCSNTSLLVLSLSAACIQFLFYIFLLLHSLKQSFEAEVLTHSSKCVYIHKVCKNCKTSYSISSAPKNWLKAESQQFNLPLSVSFQTVESWRRANENAEKPFSLGTLVRYTVLTLLGLLWKLCSERA